ncbi:MAG: hypothetical protein IH948_07595, partial [Bacteroidetes bacterium]|nr:hypothetical protein [Bacteroidota bacterium]
MTKRAILLFYCFSFSLNCSDQSYGQILDLGLTSFNKDKITFIKDSIAALNIAEVKCVVLKKKTGIQMRENGITRTYSFDTTGTIISRAFSYFNRYGHLDSIEIKFEYENELLLSERTEYYNTILVYIYEYDQNSKMVKRTYLKEKFGMTEDSVKFNRSEILSKNKFEYYYRPDKKVYKKEFINEANRVFTTIYFVYNEKGNLIREITRRTIGGTVSSTKFEYNDKNLLVKQEVKSRAGNRRIKYKYDKHQNLVEETYLTANEQVINYIFYDEKTQLLSSRTFKDVASDVIYIVKYQFKYFED